MIDIRKGSGIFNVYKCFFVRKQERGLFMKRIISLLLVFVLILPWMELKANATEISGTCGENLSWSLNESTGVLYISGTGNMDDYGYSYSGYSQSGVTTPWYSKRFTISEVVLDDGVTGIGNFAFYECRRLTRVLLSPNTTQLGAYAFYNCRMLDSISGLENVTQMKERVFYGCHSLDKIVLGSGLTAIPDRAFMACRNLKNITIPDSVSAIECYAFHSCTSLEQINLPKGLTRLAYYAFCGCSALNDITIPNSIKKIGTAAFCATALEDITIPTGVRIIGEDVFAKCTSLTTVRLSPGLESIEKRAFSECQNLKTVYFSGTPEQLENVIIRESNNWLLEAKWYFEEEKNLEKPIISISGNATTGKTELKWETVHGADFYRIYRASSKVGEFIYQKSTRSTSYTDTDAAIGESYYYKVKAVEEDTGNTSGFSNTVNRCCDLPAPEVTLIVKTDTGKPVVKWSTVSGAIKYRVYRSEKKTSGYALVYSTSAKRSYTDVSAEVGINYYYKVKAIHTNSSANSAYSEEVNRVCDLEKPVISVTLSGGDPKVTWETVEGAEKYEIWRSTSKSGEYQKVKTAITARSFTDTAAKAGTKYYYKVRAIHSNTSANSAYSSVKYITAK